MLRSLYIRLMRLHPRHFRERFAVEMLWIFDQSEEAGQPLWHLLADGALSLLRQWFYRPRLQSIETAMAAAPDGPAPLFYLGGADRPRQSALLQGGLASVAVFAGLAYVIGHSGSHPRIFVGSYQAAHSYPLPVHAGARPAENWPSQVQVKPGGVLYGHDLVRQFATSYFHGIPVLDALDANHDLTISGDEIEQASDRLAKADQDGDGRLSPQECGVRFPDTASTYPRFMRLHPVLAALDMDGDGEISPGEIRNAATALKLLDRNHDGKLALDEILPDPVDYWAARLIGLHQPETSATEQNFKQEIRRRADLDGDGVVTWEELLTALGDRGYAGPGTAAPDGSASVGNPARRN